MSILDALLNVSDEQIREREERIFLSKRLQKILRADKPVEVIIREIEPKAMKDYIAMQFDKKGAFSYDKANRAKALMTVEAVVEPDLRDERLMKKFGCASPADLAEEIFGLELVAISDLVSEMAGLSTDEEEENRLHEELKN